MFVFSIKTSKKQLVRLAGGAVIVMAALLMALFLPQESLPTAARGRSVDERVAFLHGLGYEVQSEEVGVREILIPDEFDDVFVAYNELQKQAEMDLLPYRNMRVKRYTYAVTNYPNHPQMHAHLLVYKGKIVGGDLTDTANPNFVVALTPCPAD